jgi:hypothetical protein
VLALLLPGLGHVYQRRYLRGLGWAVAFVAAVTLLIPPETVRALADAGLLGAPPSSVDPLVLLPSSAVGIASTVDAYALARRARGRGRRGRDRDGADVDVDVDDHDDDDDDGGAGVDPEGTAAAGDCTHCGRELDADLEFCPWCGAREPRREGEGRSFLSRS